MSENENDHKQDNFHDISQSSRFDDTPSITTENPHYITRQELQGQNAVLPHNDEDVSGDDLAERLRYDERYQSLLAQSNSTDNRLTQENLTGLNAIVSADDDRFDSDSLPLNEIKPIENYRDKAALMMANKSKTTVKIGDVLAEIYSDYKFIFKNYKMSPLEVFDSHGFFPMFHHYASEVVKDTYGIHIKDKVDENAEGSIFKLSVELTENDPSHTVLYWLQLISVIDNTIGQVPTTIHLDSLYDFAYQNGSDMDGDDHNDLGAFPPYIGHGSKVNK